MRRRFLPIVALAACAKSAPPQSFRDGVEIICSAGEEPSVQATNPADRQAATSAWILARLRNPEARQVFDALGEPAGDLRRSTLTDAVERAGLAHCALIDALRPDGVKAAGATLPSTPDGPTLTIAAGAVVVEGTAIVSVRDGDVDPADLDGDTMPKLVAYAAALAPHAPGTLVVDPAPETHYHLLFATIASVIGAYPAVAIMAAGDGGLGAIPVRIANDATAQDDLGLVVAITRDDLIVFSTSGRAGKLAEPRWRGPTDAIAELRTTLAAIDGAGSHHVIVVADAAQTAAVVVPALAAARASFPELVLARSLQ
jgi:hypothetical protein